MRAFANVAVAGVEASYDRGDPATEVERRVYIMLLEPFDEPAKKSSPL